MLKLRKPVIDEVERRAGPFEVLWGMGSKEGGL